MSQSGQWAWRTRIWLEQQVPRVLPWQALLAIAAAEHDERGDGAIWDELERSATNQERKETVTRIAVMLVRTRNAGSRAPADWLGRRLKRGELDDETTRVIAGLVAGYARGDPWRYSRCEATRNNLMHPPPRSATIIADEFFRQVVAGTARTPGGLASWTLLALSAGRLDPAWAEEKSATLESMHVDAPQMADRWFAALSCEEVLQSVSVRPFAATALRLADAGPPSPALTALLVGLVWRGDVSVEESRHVFAIPAVHDALLSWMRASRGARYELSAGVVALAVDTIDQRESRKSIGDVWYSLIDLRDSELLTPEQARIVDRWLYRPEGPRR